MYAAIRSTHMLELRWVHGNNRVTSHECTQAFVVCNALITVFYQVASGMLMICDTRYSQVGFDMLLWA